MTTPKLMYAIDVARLLGWGDDRWAVQRARRWMARNGIAHRDGKRFVTTPARLREVLPACELDFIEELEAWESRR